MPEQHGVGREQFAGFSRAEWLEAMTGALGKRGASSYVNALFKGAGDSPSNGFALLPETWARLALVSPSCAERVRAVTSQYGADVQAQIEEHKRILSEHRQG